MNVADMVGDTRPGRPRSEEQQRRENRLLDLLSDGNPHSSREINDIGIDPGTVHRLRRSGAVEQLHRGVYQADRAVFDKNAEIAAASLALPRAVVSLTTAARLHGLTEEQPGLWLMLPKGHRVPEGYNGDNDQIYWSRRDEAFEIGVDTMELAGVDVPVTTPERTVYDLWISHLSSRVDRPDCFHEAFANYRRKYGLPNAVGDIAQKMGRLDDQLRELIQMAVAEPVPDVGEEALDLSDVIDEDPSIEGMSP